MALAEPRCDWFAIEKHTTQGRSCYSPCAPFSRTFHWCCPQRPPHHVDTAVSASLPLLLKQTSDKVKRSVTPSNRASGVSLVRFGKPAWLFRNAFTCSAVSSSYGLEMESCRFSILGVAFLIVKSAMTSLKSSPRSLGGRTPGGWDVPRLVVAAIRYRGLLSGP